LAAAGRSSPVSISKTVSLADESLVTAAFFGIKLMVSLTLAPGTTAAAAPS